jgi:hypothetical protein
MAKSHLSRRDVLKLSAAGVLGASVSGWLDLLALRAAETQARHKSCILLWMDGGPSHKDTFDLRPGTEHGGPYRAIQTSVPGIQISEYFPNFARQMQHAAIIRSMSTGEGDHNRAKYYLHTGYREGVGGLQYPSVGSIAAMEIGDPNSPLPNYVSVGGALNSYHGAGFLGPRHQPLFVPNAARGVDSLQPLVDNQLSWAFACPRKAVGMAPNTVGRPTRGRQECPPHQDQGDRNVAPQNQLMRRASRVVAAAPA